MPENRDFSIQLKEIQSLLNSAQAEIKVRRQQIKELLPQKEKLEKLAMEKYNCDIQNLQEKRKSLIEQRDDLVNSLETKFAKLTKKKENEFEAD